MKNILRNILVILFFSSYCQSINAQNWITVGGNNQRNGLTFEHGPVKASEIWNKPTLNSIWGNQIFIFENKFVTTRYTSLNPIRASLSCHILLFGDTIWTRNYSDNGVMLVMGFRDDKIYARNFQQQGFDTIYAINPNDGSVIWKSRFTVERGIIWSAAFASNGDLILPGSGTRSVMRINHLNGDTVWTRYRIIPNTGAECMCVYGNTVYTFEGGITTPKRIMAIDINNGAIKYYSQTLPGDGDQEIPFSIGGNGVLYVIRDGGNLHALKDNGTGFTELWQFNIQGRSVGTYSQFGVGFDSSVYVPLGKKIYRINYLGNAIDSTEDLISSGTLNARFAIDGQSIFVSNGASVPSEGKNFCFTRNLQTVWFVNVPYNYYCGPAIGQPGVLVFCGAGNTITGYQWPHSGINNYSSAASNFYLFQNYPNPFNPFTIINYELRITSYVILKIFDVLGNEVTTLVNEKQKVGTYSVDWDATGYSSGVFFYKLETEGYSDVKCMLLIK